MSNALTPEDWEKILKQLDFSDQGMGDSLKARAELPPPVDPTPQSKAPAPVAQPSRLPSSLQALTGKPQSSPYEKLDYNSLDRLKDAQDRVNSNNLNVNLLNAGKEFNEGINHIKLGNSVNTALAQQANLPMDQYKQHEAGQKSDLDILKEMYQNGTTEHLRNPTGDISVAAKKVFAKMGIPMGDDVSALDIQASPVLSHLIGIKEMADARKDAAKERAIADAKKDAEREDERNSKHIEGLSKRLETSGLSELDSVLANIQKNINLNDPKQDIPGFGQTAFLPDMLVSDKGKEARQAVASLHNILLKARSGGAVTPQEAERYYKELGVGSNKSDEQLRQGVKNTIDFLAGKKKAVLSGYKPKILSEFASRGGNVTIPTYQTSDNSEDSQALKWAKENPQDPRSAEILKHLGQ